jgi:tetratricopeptide (TPR) repeat protein
MLPPDPDRGQLAAPAGAPQRDAATAAALLAQAETALDDPPRAEQQAAAAFALISHLESDFAGRHFALLLRAAWMILRSRRLAGRLRGAEEFFLSALPFLAAAPSVSGGRAALLCGLAQLRWSERRLDEAGALFHQAAAMFGEAGERQGEAACRAQCGLVLVEQLAPSRAVAELALAQVDAELAPALAARVGLVLAWCELAAGRAVQARESLAVARRLYELAPGAGEAIFRRWWEARIAFLAGQPDEADADLDAVRLRLLAEGSYSEAARATLDLLRLRVEAGRLGAVSELAPDLHDAFGCRRAFETGATIDWLATLAAQRSPRFPRAWPAIHESLCGLRRHPKDRPDLIVDVQDLADRLLVAARRAHDAAAGEGRRQEGSAR